MISEKTKIKLLERTSDKVKLEFPSIEIPIYVSQRYFKKLVKSGEYEIEK